MNLTRFIGSSIKSDLVIYVGHILAQMGHRTLIVDASLMKDYQYSFIRTEENEVLYDLQNVEIISDVRTFDTLKNQLAIANEQVENYDYILVDTNDSCTFSNWPSFENTYYISNDVRSNTMKDVEILNDYMDITGLFKVNRIHFESAFSIPKGYIELLLNNRIEIIDSFEPIEYDDKYEYLSQFIQHEYEIPYNRLNKQYKNMVRSIVTDICKVGNADVDAATGNGIFGIFKRQNLAPNKKGLHELKGVK
ncbi:MAG: hypothetical protein KBT36_11780 [Kurthia sp.]|nr:hypothetical protein [Candidatus Kurthia equi]